MAVQDFMNWCNSKVGQSLDFDGIYGAQCTDLFNYAYQYLTGRSPYADGYSVPGAKDIWNVATSQFTKVKNDINDPNQLPPQGAFLIYDGSLAGSGGYGHVAIVDSADVHQVTVWDQNWGGQFVHHQSHTWTGHEIGWMVFNGFAVPAPATEPAPVPQPEPQPTPTPDPLPIPTPEPAPQPEPIPTPEPQPAPAPPTLPVVVSQMPLWIRLLEWLVSLIPGKR